MQVNIQIGFTSNSPNPKYIQRLLTIPIDDGDVDANDGDGDGDGDDSDKRKDNSKNVSISGNRSPKPSVSRNLRSAPANRHVIPCSLDPNHDHRHSSPPPMVIHHNFLKKS